MAKVKDSGKVPNKAMHSRVSYLYQAATYLATQQQQHSKDTIQPAKNEHSEVRSFNATGMIEANMRTPSNSEVHLHPAARLLISDLRAVSLKAQLRMSHAMKHSICKNCDTFLVDGSTSTSEVENKSKGAKKPWADILVRRCNSCGTARRYPVAAERQKRRPRRSVEVPEVMQEG